MRILVTGGHGFIGSEVARTAHSAGHDVTCTTRSSAPAEEAADLSWMKVDLATEPLDLTGFDAVIHCAASLTGGEDEQQRDTVLATERLVAAAQEASLRRFVLVSTFAVYDTTHLAAGSVLDETAPRTIGTGQHPYIAAKRRQEDLVQKHFENRATILRPGLVYGPRRTWFHHLGLQRGRRWIVLAGDGLLPIVHVASCARAAARAVSSELGAETLNLIDDNLPTRLAYARELARFEESATGNVNRVQAFPWGPLNLAANLTRALNAPVGGRLPIPGLVNRRDLDARCKPFRYPNQRAKSALAWRPETDFSARLKESVELSQLGSE